MTTRKLKIEERGDYASKQTIPTVRLKGKWLEAAGFPPGKHLVLTVIASGVIELRIAEERQKIIAELSKNDGIGSNQEAIEIIKNMNSTK